MKVRHHWRIEKAAHILENIDECWPNGKVACAARFREPKSGRIPAPAALPNFEP
jgi:hypothetical protein